ncbi:MAG: universal stress protein [Pseudomonadota bacterium]
MTTQALSEQGRIARVLVATDGSEYSAGAIRTALAVAGHCGASVTGMSVALYNPEYSTLVPNLGEEAEKRAREALVSFTEAVGDGAQTLTVEAADPAQGIVEGTRQVDADVVVMGRRGKRGLARMMVGDATAKVIGHADCAVLVCPRAARLWEKRILLATDGSAHSEAAAGTAGHLAKRFNLPVTVVSVITSSHSAARRAEAEKAVNAKVERMRAQGVTVEGLIEEGRPDEAIVKAAEDVGADLIIMGSHGRTGLTKILLGSVAERVIGQAHCPVLVVKP